MLVQKTEFRIRYAETDKMGYVYYGRYAEFFEVARVEALRTIGVNYNDLEKNGISMPVLRYSIEYKKPVYYDEKIIVETTINKLPKTRIEFNFKTYNQKKECVNEAKIELVFIDLNLKKPIRAPAFLVKNLEKYL